MLCITSNVNVNINYNNYNIIFDTNSNIINPILWYKFDGSNYLKDSIGNYDITPFNNASNIIGYSKYGNGCAKFVQTSQYYFQLPKTLDFSTIQLNTGITISFWGLMKTTRQDYGKFFDFGETFSVQAIKNMSVGFLGEGSRFSFFITTAGSGNPSYGTNNVIGNYDTIYTPSYNYADGNWHHYVWSIDSSGNWQIWIDNVQYVGGNTGNNYNRN